MQVPLEEILEFHKLRTECHINCLNYFADLLGYNFPEHDNDKNSGPICVGYAYTNYVSYHNSARMTPQQIEMFNFARSEHHKTQPHHIDFYKNVVDIPDVRLVEMVCDWHSANFEQKYIQNKQDFDSVMDFFYKCLANLGWAEKQKELIDDMVVFIEKHQNHNDVLNIWNDIKGK